MEGPTQNLGPIGSAVLTFIGHNRQADKQTSRQTDKQTSRQDDKQTSRQASKYIYRLN